MNPWGEVARATVFGRFRKLVVAFKYLEKAAAETAFELGKAKDEALKASPTARRRSCAPLLLSGPRFATIAFSLSCASDNACR